MTNSVNQVINFEKTVLDESIGTDLSGLTSAWKDLIEAGEFICPGSLLIVNGVNIMDAAFASKAGFNVTLKDISCCETNLIEELLCSSPEIKLIDENIFSKENSRYSNFDYVYETAFSLILPSERKNYIQSLSRLIKPGGRLITIFVPNNKNGENESASVNAVVYHKIASEFLKLEFSSKYLLSSKKSKKEEVLQVYIKPAEQAGI